MNHMKTYLLLLAFCALNVVAQTTEPNLKWGKPSDDELQMTEYAADKEAKAVVLCHLTSVNYTMDLYNYSEFFSNLYLKFLRHRFGLGRAATFGGDGLFL